MKNSKTTAGYVNGVTLLMAVLVVVAVELPLSLISGCNTLSPLLILGISRFMEGVLIVAVLRMGKLPIAGFSMGTALPGIKKGLLWSAGFGGIVILAFLVFRALGADPFLFLRAGLPHNTVDILLVLLVGGMIAPVTEELFFRGILYGFLRRWGMPAATVISSVIFALAHTTFTGSFFIQLTGGLLFAVAYEMEKNLMVPITLHILGNLALFGISFLYG